MKLSYDPNNTAWSRSSQQFGQKLLLSRGWTPGSSLGVKGAPYVKNSANSSHVRIAVKDDNLGLGARNAGRSDDAPTTGLEGLQDLLGRLNGKDEKLLKKEGRSRENTKRTLYAERRWGFGIFVSGGLLVGDRIQDQEDESLEATAPAQADSFDDPSLKLRVRRKVHKRKKEKDKKAQKSRASNKASTSIQCAALDINLPSEKTSTVNNEEDANILEIAENDTLEAQRRSEKTERKAHRRARKAEKLVARSLEKEQAQEPPDTRPPVRDAGKQALPATTRSPEVAKVHARHTVRQRAIQHKKMSLTDQRALNEVWGYRQPFSAMLTTTDLDDQRLVLRCGASVECSSQQYCPLPAVPRCHLSNQTNLQRA